MTQNRFRSYLMWAAIIAQVAVIFGFLGMWDKLGITSDVFKGVATAILEILTLIGVINNPTSATSL